MKADICRSQPVDVSCNWKSYAWSVSSSSVNKHILWLSYLIPSLPWLEIWFKHHQIGKLHDKNQRSDYNFFNKANFKLITWLNVDSVHREKSSLVILERSSHTISTRTSPIKVVLTSQKAKRVCSLATNSLLMDSKDWNKLKQFNSICCCFWHCFCK